MGSHVPLLLLCLAAAALSSSWAAAPSADNLIASSCSIALGVFSQCSSTAKGGNLNAACCTPYSILRSFNCFCNSVVGIQSQAMMTGDVRQALLQCPGQGHISEPIKCNQNSQQVSAWLSGVDSGDVAAVESMEDIMKGVEQADHQLLIQQLNLDKSIPEADTSIIVDLTLDVNSAGGDKIVRKGIKLGTSDLGSSVSDLVAEVDFEIGPDVSSSEVRQILQGVTEWVASMVGNSADPFDDLASVERSGELSSITARVADTIFQMAGALEGVGANSDVRELTYELDLGAPEHSDSELMPMRDSMTSAAMDYSILDDMMSAEEAHMSHHHMGAGHKCLLRQTYRWLCHHREVIRMALVIELVLCAMFAAVHLVWSCCLKPKSSGDIDVESDSALKAPLIESASAYTSAEQKMIISPLWARVMSSEPGVSAV